MKEGYPDSKLVLRIGSDKLSGFDGWKNADIIAQNAIIGVLFRGDKGEKESVESKKAELEKHRIRVELVNNTVTSISSSQLRRLVAFDCAEPFLPEGVADYIRVHKLYDSCADFKNLPMEQLEPVVVRLLRSNRVAHVLGCRDTAVKLAEHWGADRTDAARAGILHDITKALDGPLQLTLCDEYGTMLDEFSQKYPKTLHALTGSLVAERIFGENREVVEAIRHHTTGKANMSLLEKLFMWQTIWSRTELFLMWTGCASLPIRILTAH